METIGISFTDDMYGIIVREARKKNIRPETLLKIWILERVKVEGAKVESNQSELRDPLIDMISMPLKASYIITASATAAIGTLVEELIR
ncbi:MAG: hypothetical protein QXU32_12045 [Nitrososphaerales archaeon]